MHSNPENCEHFMLIQCAYCSKIRCSHCKSDFREKPRNIRIAARLWCCESCYRQPKPEFVIEEAENP